MTHRFTNTLPPDAVPASSGLWVSQDGMVFKAVHNAKTPPMYHILRAQKDGTISITTDKGRVKVSAARIVAGAFLPNPGGFSRVHHLDNDPANNAVSNLRWGEAPGLQEGPGGCTVCSMSMDFDRGGTLGTPGTEKGPEGPLCENVVGEATQRAPGE